MAKKKVKKKSTIKKPDGSELVGEKSIFSLLSQSDPLSEVKSWIKTGLPLLDTFLSNGRGVPCGKLMEVYGEFSSGKTAFCHFLMERVSQAGGWIVFFDFENSLDKEHIRCYNIREDRFLYAAPDSLEKAFEGMYDFLEVADEYSPFIIVLDSVAAAVSEKEKDLKDSVAPIARIMSTNLRKFIIRLSGKNGFSIFTNQTRTKIGSLAFDKTSRPGGKALDFYSDIIIHTKTIESIKKTTDKKEYVIGYVLKMETKKNRKAFPRQKIEFMLSFTNGFNYAENMLHHLIYSGAAKKRGGLIHIGNEKYKPNNLIDKIRSNPEEFTKLLKKDK